MITRKCYLLNKINKYGTWTSVKKVNRKYFCILNFSLLHTGNCYWTYCVPLGNRPQNPQLQPSQVDEFYQDRPTFLSLKLFIYLIFKCAFIRVLNNYIIVNFPIKNNNLKKYFFLQNFCCIQTFWSTRNIHTQKCIRLKTNLLLKSGLKI